MGSVAIPAGFVRAAWIGPTLILADASWKSNLVAVYRENTARTVILSFRPQNTNNAVSQLEQGQFYFLRVHTPFMLDDSLITLAVPTNDELLHSALLVFSGQLSQALAGQLWLFPQLGIYRALSDFTFTTVPSGEDWEFLLGASQVPQARASVFRNGQQLLLPYDGLNEDLQSGDEVTFTQPLTLPTWVLKNGVTYHTNNVPLNSTLITDGGLPVKASVLGGSALTSMTRAVYLTNSGSDITIEADLYLQTGGTTVELQNGATLRHKGLLGGFDGNSTVVKLTGNSQFYHVGKTIMGGSSGVVAAGASYAEFRETEAATFGFRPAIDLRDTATVDWYGSITRTSTGGYALAHNAQLVGNSVLRFHEGTFTNTDVAVVNFEGNARLELGTLATLQQGSGGAASGPATGVIARHAGGTIIGGTATVTVLELPADYTPLNETYLYIDSTSSARIRRLRLQDYLSVRNVVLDENASGVSYQVAQYLNGAWVGGLEQTSMATINAEIAAIAPQQFVAGVALMVKTIPLNPANISTIILTVRA